MSYVDEILMTLDRSLLTLSEIALGVIFTHSIAFFVRVVQWSMWARKRFARVEVFADIFLAKQIFHCGSKKKNKTFLQTNAFIQIAKNSLKQVFGVSKILHVQKCQCKSSIFDSILTRPVFFFHQSVKKVFVKCLQNWILYCTFHYSMRLLLKCWYRWIKNVCWNVLPNIHCLANFSSEAPTHKRAFLISNRSKLLRANGYGTHEPSANEQNPRLILQRGPGLSIARVA